MKQLSNIKFLDQFCNIHINSIESLNVCQTKYEHQSICFTRIWDFTWRVSDCEELVVRPEYNN